MAILPANPKANYLAHKQEIEAAVARVLESGWYILGEEVTAFEKEFSAYIGVGHGVGVASGTDALELALRACGIGQGDAVITVSHTAVATVAAIELAGAIPVLVDIDPGTYTMDPDSLESALREMMRRPSSEAGRPRAVIPVHLYGHPANMLAIMEVAQRYDLCVIEDCAQSHGAALDGRKTGTWGHVAAFSFYPTKNLGALGDAGLVVTDDDELAERARVLREYGWKERYVSDMPGMNTRLDELQAAVLRVKLRHLDDANETRRRLAQLYSALLANTDLTPPQTRSGAIHVYHQYVVRSPQRDALRAFLRERGIGTLIHYPSPVHLQPAYRNRLSAMVSLRQTEETVRQILSLPMFPELTEEEVRTVARHIMAWEGARDVKD